jgi:predicted PurR-regulated permease PerM
MIRFVSLVVLAALALWAALGGITGIFGGVVLLAVCVASFGLFVALCTELLGEN